MNLFPKPTFAEPSNPTTAPDQRDRPVLHARQRSIPEKSGSPVARLQEVCANRQVFHPSCLKSGRLSGQKYQDLGFFVAKQCAAIEAGV